MRSSNPVFSRRFRDNGYAGFNAGSQGPQAGTAAQGNPYASNPYAEPANPYAANPYAQGGPDLQQGAPYAPPQPSRMTMDDVVMRTGMTLGTVILLAAVGWAANVPVGVGFGAAIVAMVLGLIQSFKAKPVPALILGYAAFEGLFLGVISKAYNQYADGAPVQAVLGTMAVSVGVLIAYKTRLIRVDRRFIRFVTAAAIGFVLLMMVNMLFAVFGGGDGLGLRSGWLGIGVGVLGVLIGAAFLAIDFKEIEDGVRYGAPRDASWHAAFGLTLSLVWIYVQMLQLVSAIAGND
ncbi:Bax inhibitor-1/YccA family protein [Streptomyces sp. ISL-11]|uniref:Bax inhibitor-1/YccA family protein n=1 Tax=Streptomyces sp. ISL-11 TaxID=2819174 RepID=UPI001BE522C3|nr:Bax inhibitor-1/YccA family protein [Streptomyces sp. ISL-11]MBT2386430.1 Bax inhibitor-1/YccA family protein [Streptomyces sp. ISL-11]